MRRDQGLITRFTNLLSNYGGLGHELESALHSVETNAQKFLSYIEKNERFPILRSDFDEFRGCIERMHNIVKPNQDLNEASTYHTLSMVISDTRKIECFKADAKRFEKCINSMISKAEEKHTGRAR